MNRRIRHLMVAAALVALMAGPAACGRDADTGRDTAKPIGSGRAQGEITVWAMGTEGEKLTALAADFMAENPEAKVKITPIPWDGAHDKIATAIAGRQVPDLSLIGTTWMGEFAGTGGLDPTPPGLVDKASFFGGSWDTTVVNGTSYGVPWYVETRLFYVNRQVAARAGVTSAPKSWEELTAAVRAFKEKGGARWGIYLQPGGAGSWQTVLPFVWQNGGDVLSGKKFTLDSAQVADALAYYQSFFTGGLAPKDLPQGALEPDFAAGRIGAFISGPWHIGLLAAQKAAGKYLLWPMPTRQAATSFVGGGDLAVFTDAKNRDGAWKFVSYLTRPQVQTKWYQTVNDLPSVRDGWNAPAIAGDPQLAAFGAQLSDARSPASIGTWDEVAAGIDGEVEKLARSAVDPQEVAGAMQRKATAVGTGS